VKVFEYEVKQTEHGFEARTPYREIVYLANTEREAIGGMLKGVAELAWKGSLDPAAPTRVGSPPLQHTMDILCDHLQWHLERRRERIEDSHSERFGDPGDSDAGRFGGAPDSSETLWAQGCYSDLARTNEVISGLATSIAALSRIKAL
jgi:hypothetical protein